MHIPDGFVSGGINTATYIAVAVAGTIAVAKINKNFGEKQVPLLGITAAFVFAAQMLNFPVAGGTSGHFLGAVLAAILLGPWAAFIVLALVLAIQCLIFADGGLTALGTNIFNMGIVGGIGFYYVFIWLKTLFPKNRAGFLAAVSVTSWLSVVVASAICSLELALSGTVPIGIALPAMVSVHSVIGIGEALITSVVISMVLASRPDLVSTYNYIELSIKPQEA